MQSRYVSLRSRLLLANATIIVGLGILLLLIMNAAFSKPILKELQRHWLTTTQRLADDVVAPILTRDELALRALAFDNAGSIPDARYVFVTDERGTVLAHTFDSGFPADLKDVGRNVNNEVTKTELMISRERVLDICAPVLNGSIGWTHIGFSQEAIHRDSTRLVTLVALSIVVALILQVLLTAAMATLITRPMRRVRTLAGQVRRIGQGKRTDPVDVRGGHEIGELAAAYNAMREDLQAYQLQLRTLASQLALVEEKQRRHIASELHDRVGQTILTAKMKLEGMEASAEDPDQARQLARVHELMDTVIKDTRSLIFEISPPVLYEVGFAAALEWLCDQMKDRHGIRIEFSDADTSIDIAEDLSVILFQAVRELLFNVAKHANTDSASLSLQVTDERLRITVRDNGSGFDVASRHAAGPDAGYGLFSIREALRRFDGDLTLQSQSDLGTTATVSVEIGSIADNGEATE